MVDHATLNALCHLAGNVMHEAITAVNGLFQSDNYFFPQLTLLICTYAFDRLDDYKSTSTGQRSLRVVVGMLTENVCDEKGDAKMARRSQQWMIPSELLKEARQRAKDGLKQRRGSENYPVHDIL